jgi:hypothetical protein
VITKHLGCGDVNEADPGGWCSAWNKDPLMDENGYGYFYTENFNSAAWNGISFITFTISATVMGAIGLFQLVIAVMYRRGLLITAVWAAYALVVIVVFSMDWFYPTEQYYPFAIASGLSLSAVVPLVYLLVVWSVVQYMKWQDKKAVEADKAAEEQRKKNQ